MNTVVFQLGSEVSEAWTPIQNLGSFCASNRFEFNGMIQWTASQSFMVHDASWWRNYAMGSVRLSHLTIVLAMS